MLKLKPWLLFIVAIIYSNTIFANEQNTSKLNQIEDRLSDLELSSILRKFSFSGNMMNHFEHLEETKVNQTDDKKERTTLNPVLMRVGLNFDVQISNNLNFYSSLGMSKFWNQSGRDGNEVGEGGQYKSLKSGYELKDSSTFIDTAYLTYKVGSTNSSVALGRMTTNNGSPIEQLDGTQRMGTYPRFAYNSIFDGLAYIYDASSYIPENQSLIFRFFYTPFVYVDKKNRGSQAVDSADNRVESLQAQTALLTEYTIKSNHYFKELNLYHMYWKYENFYDDSFQDDSNDEIEDSSSQLNMFYLGFKKIFNSNINFSYSYYTFEEQFAHDSASSFNYFINFNYTFNNRVNENHILGFEYINTDDVYYLEDHNSLYIADFYTRNHNNGYHIFYTIPVGAHQIFRFGYFNYKSSPSTWNEIEDNSKVTSLYARWQVYF